LQRSTPGGTRALRRRCLGIDGRALLHGRALLPSSAELVIGTMMNAARPHLTSFRSAPKSCGRDLRCTSKVVEVPVVRRIPFAPDDSSLLRPVAGDEATGYGVSRSIAAVPDWQPLGHDEIWRVILHGEVVVRVVRHSSLPGVAAHWQLLQIDDMTDEQLDIYDAALSDPHGSSQS